MPHPKSVKRGWRLKRPSAPLRNWPAQVGASKLKGNAYKFGSGSTLRMVVEDGVVAFHHNGVLQVLL
jgi:hypothetical protein